MGRAIGVTFGALALVAAAVARRELGLSIPMLVGIIAGGVLVAIAGRALVRGELPHRQRALAAAALAVLASALAAC